MSVSGTQNEKRESYFEKGGEVGSFSFFSFLFFLFFLFFFSSSAQKRQMEDYGDSKIESLELREKPHMLAGDFIGREKALAEFLELLLSLLKTRPLGVHPERPDIQDSSDEVSLLHEVASKVEAPTRKIGGRVEGVVGGYVKAVEGGPAVDNHLKVVSSGQRTSHKGVGLQAGGGKLGPSSLQCRWLHPRKRKAVDLDQRLVVVVGLGRKDLLNNVGGGEAKLVSLKAQLTLHLLGALADNALERSKVGLAR